MPGPGGGSHGGGGSRGGFGGGSSGGFGGGGRGGFGGPRGGFGGPPPHRPHGYYGWFGPRYRRPYYSGGGCLGGMMAMLVLPIILILVAFILIMSLFGSALGTIVSGGEVIYDENTYQDYANEMYYAEFGSSDAFEDNILLVFLVDKDFYDYNFIAWVGDDIETKVNYMFGNEQSELGRAIQSSAINSQSYKYSMGQGITQVAEHMQEKIVALGLDSNFKCQEDRSKTDSHITNYTDLQINASTVDKALEEFTKATGIPIVVVVEYREDVFGKTISPTDIFLVIIAIGLIVLAIVLIVNAVKKRPKGDGDDGTYRRNDSSGDYSGDYSGF